MSCLTIKVILMTNTNIDKTDENESTVDKTYNKITRVMEGYIILCFVLVTIIPLLEYAWVPPFVRFIYFTGFPMLLILILVSLVKDNILDNLKRKYDETPGQAKSAGRK